jgi:hypothetical protein
LLKPSTNPPQPSIVLKRAGDMAAKETIDIEALLHRAYAQHRVDRVAPGDVLGMPRAPGLAQSAWAERVDTSAPGARLAAWAKQAKSMPDDMLVLHDAVLALGEMWVGLAGDDVAIWTTEEAEAAGHARLKDGESVYMARDGVRAGWLAQAGTAVLVMVSARDGVRPDWCAGWRPARGRPAADAGKVDRRGRRRAVHELSAAEVQCKRAMYHVWRCALLLLVAQLDGELDAYRVTGPVAPSTPWLDLRDRAAETAPINQNATADNALIS